MVEKIRANFWDKPAPITVAWKLLWLCTCVCTSGLSWTFFSMKRDFKKMHGQPLCSLILTQLPRTIKCSNCPLPHPAGMLQKNTGASTLTTVDSCTLSFCALDTADELDVLLNHRIFYLLIVMWKINTAQWGKFTYEQIFSICETTIYSYASIYFHYILIQVSSNQMLLWNSGTLTEILLYGTFPGEETGVVIWLKQFPFLLF